MRAKQDRWGTRRESEVSEDLLAQARAVRENPYKTPPANLTTKDPTREKGTLKGPADVEFPPNDSIAVDEDE